MLRAVLLTLFLFCYSLLSAQQQPEEYRKYLVYLSDKNNTPFSIQQPEKFLGAKAISRRHKQQINLTSRDLPVDPAYVTTIKSTGAEVWYTSRWFNAVVIRANQAQLNQVNALPFIKQAKSLNKVSDPEGNATLNQKQQVLKASGSKAATLVDSKDFGVGFNQADMLGVPELQKAGYQGQGMTIAVLDAGFPGVNTIPAFSHLYQQGQLKATFDFVERKKDVYGANAHGTAVLSTMAAYEPGKMIGTAPYANYILLRTEDAATEHNIEEVNWLIAAEFADSAGADVINSSLGYSTFDAPSESYTYPQMDGNTTIVTRAADFAAATGMLVVVSAGNEGNKAWRYITAPADADSVLTVGAVDVNGEIASFSSRGPAADGRVKPDVVALGANTFVLNSAGEVVNSSGTSFSGPIMAGFAASLWLANSSKTNYELIQLIRQLGDRATAPDNIYGYGIPNYKRVVTALPPTSATGGVIAVNPMQGTKLDLLLDKHWQTQRLQLQFFDATGKLLFSKQVIPDRERLVIDLQQLALSKGVYICRVVSGKKAATLRVVKL